MVVVSESVHPRGLDFQNQRKVVILRDVHGLTFPEIAKQVKTLCGGRPSARSCCLYYHSFSGKVGRRCSRYKNCGRNAWKLTHDVQRFLLQKLKQLRKSGLCTCAILQREVAREKGVALEISTIRKFLHSKGYKWLPRAQKRKYTAAQMRARVAFAQQVLALGPARLREKLSFAMDGCVLTILPRGHIDRLNFLRTSQSHMWRLKSERFQPQLAGQDMFSKQCALDRSIPLWGGLSQGGFSTVLYHPRKKLCTSEWVDAARGGKLVDAIKALNPVKEDGPWHILCDNERFLTAPKSMAEYRKLKIRLWQIPPKSPDLNPVEQFWSYLRKRLRAMDFRDALEKKAVLGKMAYKARVKRVIQSVGAQRTAGNIAKGFAKICREVVRKGGAASSR